MVYSCSIYNNYDGIYLSSSSGTLVSNCSIYKNKNYGVFSSSTVNASYNWWGDASGPYHPTLNPDGKGDNVSSNVIFIPWLTISNTGTELHGEISPPSAPLNLQATAGDGYVTLTWQAPSNNGGATITSYKIYRGTSSGGEVYLTSVTTTSYNDTTVTNGVTYYYRVSAVNSAGEGSKSNEAHATPHATVSQNQPPTITITYPLDNATVNGIITIKGTANDDKQVVMVEIRIDGKAWIQANGTTSWEYDIDTKELTNGMHIIEARAYDGRDYSDIASIHIEVKNEKKTPGFGVIILFTAIATAISMRRKRK